MIFIPTDKNVREGYILEANSSMVNATRTGTPVHPIQKASLLVEASPSSLRLCLAEFAFSNARYRYISSRDKSFTSYIIKSVMFPHSFIYSSCPWHYIIEPLKPSYHQVIHYIISPIHLQVAHTFSNTGRSRHREPTLAIFGLVAYIEGIQDISFSDPRLYY